MAESLALGIIPLCIEGLKLGRALKKKLLVFKSYMHTVEEVQTLFDVQVMSFIHECKLVITAATKDCEDLDLRQLLENFQHESWSSPLLEESLQSFLGTSEDCFKMLLKVICRRISRIERELAEYDELDDKGKEVVNEANYPFTAKGGTAIHRFGHKIRVSFDEDMYDKEIEKLRRLISNLRGLRERASTDAVRGPDKPPSMPSDYRLRKQHAALWLNSMTANWSCSDKSQPSHSVKLLLATENSKQTCLDVVIHHSHISTSSVQETKYQLCVQPRAVRPTGLLTPETSAEELLTATEYEPKRRKIRHADDVSKSCTARFRDKSLASPVGSQLTEKSSDSISLSAYDDVCRYLCNAQRLHEEKYISACLGHMELRQKRFDFFPGHQGNTKPVPFLSGSLVPLQGIFHKDLDESVGDPQRFWLASLIVKSALRLHNTPWWPENWNLDYLSFYERPMEDLMDSLQSLHISADLPSTASQQPSFAGNASCPSHADVDTKLAMTEHGIRNLTLWCVGVALLQIGLWRPIRWDSHVEVRESLGALERLSKQYYNITDRLINCDFGKGARLQNPELQNEIYRSVVCELDAILDEFRKAGIWGVAGG